MESKEDIETLIRHIDADQKRLLETTDPHVFQGLKDQFARQLRMAKERLATYEELADLWRGLELNLTLFQSRVRGAEERIRVAQRNPTTVCELSRVLQNPAQVAALRNTMINHPDHQLYLSGFEAAASVPGGSRASADVEGTFTVLGSMRKGVRESYSVKWYRMTAVGKPSFWCNCPDHKFNSTKKNMCCKHICFLVTRVGRILDPVFFESKRLTVEQHAAFAGVIRDAAVFADGSRERERIAARRAATAEAAAIAAMPREEVRAVFEVQRKPVVLEDMCPICYDAMDSSVNLNCPTCSNNVHRECMEVWLERNSTCVFCRSDVWRRWRGGVISHV
jgi:hypothetical protein